MARLDLYRLPGLDGYVVEVQADLMATFSTTVVIPLLPLDIGPPPMARLNPVFDIGGRQYAMATQSISAISRKELGSPVGTLGESKHYDVLNALDMLLAGS